MEDKQANRRAWWKAWREKNKERLREKNREYQRKYYAKHAVKIRSKRDTDADRIRQRGEYAKNKEQRRAYRFKKAYGLSMAEYDAMRDKQGGRCAICRTDSPMGLGNRLYVDHCHETGAIRELLCSKCNLVLGNANDSAETLRAAAAYVERHAALVLTEPKKSS